MGHAQNNPEQYAGLFAAGYDAVKEIFPEAIAMVHLDNGFDENLYNWNLDILKNNGAKFDMIGMSLYPYWAMDAGHRDDAETTITDCIANIKKVSEKYGCDVMIVETGMEALKPEEGYAQLSRIIRECKENTKGYSIGNLNENPPNTNWEPLQKTDDLQRLWTLFWNNTIKDCWDFLKKTYNSQHKRKSFIL